MVYNGKEYFLKNKEKWNLYQRNYLKNLKRQIIKHYGNKCICCDETEIEFLSIDHIKGGGNKHRKQLGTSSIQLYYWIKNNNYPNNIQILCMNCNWAKGKLGYCPHSK